MAVVPASPEDEGKLQPAATTVARTFAALLTEPADPWVKVVVPRVPTCICSLHENCSATTLLAVTYDELMHKRTTAFGAGPTQSLWALAQDEYLGSRSVLDALRPGELKHLPSWATRFSTRLLVYLRRRWAKASHCAKGCEFHQQKL